MTAIDTIEIFKLFVGSVVVVVDCSHLLKVVVRLRNVIVAEPDSFYST